MDENSDLEAAHRAHAFHNNLWFEAYRSTIQLGLESLRASALINGGAVVAGLAFAGAIYDDDKAAVGTILLAIYWFALGVIASGIATCFGHVSELAFAWQIGHRKGTWTYPFIEGDTWTFYKIVGKISFIVTFLSVIGSYTCLLVGVTIASDILNGQT